MAAVTSVTPSSDTHINALLGNYKWASGSLTYSFPTSASYYASGYGDGEPLRNFEGLNATQQSAVRAAFANFAAVANVTFSELTGANAANATLRLAMSDAPSTAWAYMPHTSPEGGDSWYNNASGVYDNPRKGNYANTTFLHEIGHALGLEHPHENGMPVGGDSMEFSVMSYRAYVGAPLTGYPNESWGYAQSLMMYDIAAMQHLYGANFSSNSGNTTYSWSPTTGQAFINGVGQGTPGGNRIFQTVWDGGGTDTYDFSNYTTNLSVDLRPGQWTTTSSTQLARLHYSGSQIADGNIANAKQYNGDIRSLIDNAIGGSGNDVIRGNAIANTLSGGVGNDDLYGLDGSDILVGGAGFDYLDGGAGSDTALYSGNFADYSVSTDGIYRVVRDLRNAGDDADYLINVEMLRFADGDIPLAGFLTGTISSEVLHGTVGNDTIYGFAGNDDLYGKDGDDILVGGAGFDYLDGGAGSDTALYSGNFVDYSVSTDGIYRVVRDLRNAGDGTDYLINVETLRFADGDISTFGPINGTSGSEVLHGTAGNDTIYGFAGNDDLYGKDGDDVLVGGAGFDYLDGGAGSDTALYSGNFADYSVSTDGIYRVVRDLRNAGDDIDYLINVEAIRFADGDISTFGPFTSGPINGTSGSEVLHGTAGNDTIYGFAGNDDLYGKDGDDVLVGGAGFDYLDGGAGSDTALYSGNFADYTVSTDGIYRVVGDLRSAGDDTDYLINVETLRFADGDVSILGI